MTLFGKRGFVGVIKDLEVTCILDYQGSPWIQRQVSLWETSGRETNGRGGHEKVQADVEVT